MARKAVSKTAVHELAEKLGVWNPYSGGGGGELRTNTFVEINRSIVVPSGNLT